MEERDRDLLAGIETDVLNESVPVAAALRKCIILGGRAGSAELRDWASKELRGYDSPDDVPPYRILGAPLRLDANVGPGRITGQTISPSQLPEPLNEIEECVRIPWPIAEVQKAAEREKPIRLSFPNQPLAAAILTKHAAQPFHEVTEIYWTVPTQNMAGIVDQVRTVLATFIADLTAALPPHQSPSASAMNQALTGAIHNDGGTVQITYAEQGSRSTSQAGDGQHQSGAIESKDGSRLWRLLRKPGSMLVGAAVILGAFATLAAWLWPR